MTSRDYESNIIQANGCHTWQNPLTGVEFEPPNKTLEIFIKNIPKDMSKQELFTNFERFGEIYQFRLLIDYDGLNRGFAYLIYFVEKSALECLDCMGYFIIKPGVILDVEKSEERSNLLALGIPSQLSDEIIVCGFQQLFVNINNVLVQRRGNETVAILSFPNHAAALNAKRWSGVGSINLWNRQIKILWAKEEEIERLRNPIGEAKHVLFHNVLEDLEVKAFGEILSKIVPATNIVSIRPMKTDWLVRLIDSNSALQIANTLHMSTIANQIIIAEWIDSERLKSIKSFVDFDFELRCFCYANYYDPPIFIYGRIIPLTRTQFVAVIIKNNRKNMFVTIIIEMSYDELTEIHSRVCETILIALIDFKDFPKQNLVMKVSTVIACIAGHIPNLHDPKFYTSFLANKESISIYLGEVFDLAGMCAQLLSSGKLVSDDGQSLELLFNEYKQIIGEKNINHQFISNVKYKNFVLGCIDPRYRGGKPLKYQMNTRETILVMCDALTRSNVINNHVPGIVDSKSFPLSTSSRLKIEKFELLPLEKVQRQEKHFAVRPCIEFNQVDTHSSLYTCLRTLATGIGFPYQMAV